MAFNRTNKAREALYLTTYLTEKWGLQLIVQILGETEEEQAAAQDEAQAYLSSQGMVATFVTTEGDSVDAILTTATIYERDLIIIGGYSATPLAEMVRDSNVNMLLRKSRLPLLVCR